MNKSALRSYIIGFGLSLFLTFAAFIPVILNLFSKDVLLLLIVLLALVQLMVQLLFFLHLGREKKPYFNAMFLFFTAGMIILVIVASIWIMNHLNYSMTPSSMNEYLIKDEGLQY